MAKLGIFFKTLGTKIATLWKTTTWFKIVSIGGAVVVATSAVVIPNAVVRETGGIFHKCEFSVENIDTNYLYSVANCTEKAKYYYSCACGEKGTELFEYGNALEHDLTHHESKQVTCTDIGYDDYDTCSRCDYSTYNEISATGHTDGEWITDKEANCTEDGSKHQICAVCNATIKTETLTKLGHTDGQWITDKEANCTEDGSKHQVCSVCNDTIKTETLTKLGHTDGEWITDKEANCTEDGSKHQVCSVCNNTIKTETLTKLGHTDGEWIADKEANCTEDGSKHQVCSVCEDIIKTETITKFGHNKTTFISAEKIAGSYYASWYCGICENNYIEEFQAISARFSVSISYGTYPQYIVNISPSGGLGTYSYTCIVYNRYSGAVLGTPNVTSNRITYTDYNGNNLWDNNLVLRIYMYDAIGEIIFDLPLNDGKFSSSEEYSIVSAYSIY